MCTNGTCKFFDWLDKYLTKDLSTDILAVNFNLYEGVEKSEEIYFIELVGCNVFDETNEDWACKGVSFTGKDFFIISKTSVIAHWEKGLIYITNLAKNYLDNGKHANKLKSLTAVGIGFVDGNINIIHQSV